LVAIGFQILRLKCTKFDFGAYSAAPDPLAAPRGPTSKGRGKERRGEGEGPSVERPYCRELGGHATPPGLSPATVNIAAAAASTRWRS